MKKLIIKTRDATLQESMGTFNDDAKISLGFIGSRTQQARLLRAIQKVLATTENKQQGEAK